MLFHAYTVIKKYKILFPSWRFHRSFFLIFFFMSVLNPVYADYADYEDYYDAHSLYNYVKSKRRVPTDLQDVNVMTRPSAQTALHLAIAENDLESARILLDAGADVNCAKYEFDTQVGSPLHNATTLESAQLLVDSGADIDSQACYGRTTPIYQAIIRQNKDVVTFLLEQGADVNKGAIRDNDWFFFITHEAIGCFFHYPVFGESILFPRIFSMPQLAIILTPAVLVCLPITILAEAGDINLATAILSYLIGCTAGILAGIQAAGGPFGDNPVLLRIEHALQKLNLPPTKAQELPVQAAIALKDNELVDMLIRKGADLNVVGKSLTEALAQVVETYRNDEDAGIELLKTLIEKGADVDKKPLRILWSLHLSKSGDYDSILDLAQSLRCNKMAEFLAEQSELGVETLSLDEAHPQQINPSDTFGALQGRDKQDRLKPKAYRNARKVVHRHRMFTTPALMPLKKSGVTFR